MLNHHFCWLNPQFLVASGHPSNKPLWTSKSPRRATDLSADLKGGTDRWLAAFGLIYIYIYSIYIYSIYIYIQYIYIFIYLFIYLFIYHTGWWFQPLWKIWKSVRIIIPNIWKNKKWSKPPTSICMLIHMWIHTCDVTHIFIYIYI